MSPLLKHERRKSLLGQFVRILARELHIPVMPTGSTTWSREDLDKGLEADESFYLGDLERIADPDDVDLGTQFDAILPSLWLAAGGVGPRESGGKGFTLPAGSRYAVLFDESAFRKLRKALETRPDVTHVWIVTDSEDAYAEMRSALPGRPAIGPPQPGHVKCGGAHDEQEDRIVVHAGGGKCI